MFSSITMIVPLSFWTEAFGIIIVARLSQYGLYLLYFCLSSLKGQCEDIVTVDQQELYSKGI